MIFAYYYTVVKVTTAGVRMYYNLRERQWERRIEPECYTQDKQKAIREFEIFRQDNPQEKFSVWKFKLTQTAASDSPKKDYS